jgi:hypothetical protein
MNKIILVIFVLNASVAAAQKIPDSGFNHVRLNGDNRTLSFETLPVNSPYRPVLSKTYFWYAAGQVQITRGGYSGKLLNGYYRTYFLNKNLAEEGTFNAGLRDGTWKKWNEAGLLQEVSSWKDGLRNGLSSVFDDSGRLKSDAHYQKDLLEGTSKEYNNGDSVVIKHYHKGRMVQPLPFIKRINPFRRKTRTPVSPAN